MHNDQPTAYSLQPTAYLKEFGMKLFNYATMVAPLIAFSFCCAKQAPQVKASQAQQSLQTQQATQAQQTVAAQTAGDADTAAQNAKCPQCEDGFGKNCYIDMVLHKGEALKSGIELPQETEDLCFALEEFSYCHSCYHSYFLRKGADLVPVSKDEFERALSEKNKSCNNCLNFIQSGPG
jgi:hypothetical protein